jgi:hypothetical protein
MSCGFWSSKSPSSVHCRRCTRPWVRMRKPNDYFGPGGLGSMSGYPAKEDPLNVSKSETHAAKLWEESEKLAKLNFTI